MWRLLGIKSGKSNLYSCRHGAGAEYLFDHSEEAMKSLCACACRNSLDMPVGPEVLPVLSLAMAVVSSSCVMGVGVMFCMDALREVRDCSHSASLLSGECWQRHC